MEWVRPGKDPLTPHLEASLSEEKKLLGELQANVQRLERNVSAGFRERTQLRNTRVQHQRAKVGIHFTRAYLYNWRNILRDYRSATQNNEDDQTGDKTDTVET